jgi:hypothetical protein
MLFWWSRLRRREEKSSSDSEKLTSPSFCFTKGNRTRYLDMKHRYTERN